MSFILIVSGIITRGNSVVQMLDYGSEGPECCYCWVLKQGPYLKTKNKINQCLNI